MGKRANNSTTKFNLRERYSQLGDDAKRIFKEQATRKFDISESQLYRRLVSDKLTADELIFFSQIFDCTPEDLYSIPPKKTKDIGTLEKRKGVKAYNTKRAIATDLGLAKAKSA